MTPRAVVFDIGNVLIEWNPERFYDRTIGVARRKALFAEVDLEGMNRQLDLGAPFRETVEALARQHPEWSAEIMAWHDHWLDMASPEIPDSVRLLQGLRANAVRTVALTNFGTETFGIAERAYPFLRAFDLRVVSGHLALMKPDPQIYQHVENATGLSGADLFFTDDRPENVEAAAARGWQVHLFDGPQGLARRLRDLGLPVDEEAA
ncbi:2-haloacid dehalogenase [Albidovulum inexpectatum]|uniref:2-haloacid dehalogenase n=1 Tax=Albidovulum inexpectatum TaxID=196587 RepID=A0A2S5JFL9_9RHOB|nr:HAD family phosphatase [Albidovulum inexpectatum]PPB80287.1 2-haloacid dehalogenase [Albidovulum inexpectatum]